MTVNCKGKLMDLSFPKVMAILNCTSDSFYDGGKYPNEKSIANRIDNMIAEGADCIDIGGQSTRPGAKAISAEDEWNRIQFAVQYIAKNHPEQIFSIDSFWSETHRKGAEYGQSLINDISAGSRDIKMFETVADLQLPYVLMHLKGLPENMQYNTEYKNVTLEVNTFLSQKIEILNRLGIVDILLDPGFGFGKNIEQNFTLLRELRHIGFGSFPLLVGLSRKSMIYKSLALTPDKALNGSSVLHTFALMHGAHILRVHDVAEARQCIALYELYQAGADES